MKKFIQYASAGLIAGSAMLMAATPAAASNVNWAVSIGVPAPVVYAAPPVMYSPPPVAYSAPVVYGPPAVMYSPAPVVYVSGGPQYYRQAHYRHGGRYRGHPYYRH